MRAERKGLRTEATHEHQAANRIISFGQMEDAPNRGTRIIILRNFKPK
jgi:hypothetical protein